MLLFDKKIVRINELILSVFPKAVLYGLCFQVTRGNQLEIRQPKKQDNTKLNGFDDTPIRVDDDHELQCYHRITGEVTHSYKNKVWGRSQISIESKGRLSLIVSTSNRAVHDALIKILAAFALEVVVVDTDFDMYRVWTREWGNPEDRPNFENYLYAIEYDLTATDNSCAVLSLDKDIPKDLDFRIFDDTFNPVFE